MYVALGAVEASRLLEQHHVGGGLEISGLARLDGGIAGLLRDERQPADFQFGAGRNDEIGASRTRDQARLRLDVMGVLQRVGRDVDLDLVTTKLLHKRAPFGKRREHIDCRKRRTCERQTERNNTQPQHRLPWRGSFQNLCAPCAPSVRMYWTKISLSVKSGLSFACWYWMRKRLNSEGVQSSITRHAADGSGRSTR